MRRPAPPRSGALVCRASTVAEQRPGAATTPGRLTKKMHGPHPGTDVGKASRAVVRSKPYITACTAPVGRACLPAAQAAAARGGHPWPCSLHALKSVEGEGHDAWRKSFGSSPATTKLEPNEFCVGGPECNLKTKINCSNAICFALKQFFLVRMQFYFTLFSIGLVNPPNGVCDFPAPGRTLPRMGFATLPDGATWSCATLT